MTVHVVVSGELVLHGLPVSTTSRLVDMFQLPNPKYASLARYGRDTRGVPRVLDNAIEMPDGSIHVPRGAWPIVKEQLQKDKLAFAIDDRRTTGARMQVPTFSVTLRDYQVEGINAFQRAKQGMIVLACGGGKTMLGAAIAHGARLSTLVLVHTTDLAAQWVDTFRRLGFAPGDVSVLGGGERETPFAPITVGLVRSVLNRLEEEPVWGAGFGLVIHDEMHHCPCAMAQEALRQLPAKYRLGLTATPYREDGLTDMMGWSFGSILLQKTLPELVAAGYLQPATLELVETNFEWAWDGPKNYEMAALDKALATHPARNALIAARVDDEAAFGETVLVLVRTLEHAALLVEGIEALGTKAVALHGKRNKKDRAGIVAGLRDGTIRVAVATSLADEGLDLPRLGSIHLASPQRAKGATTQRLGRLMRLWEGKKPRLHDYIDSKVPTLRNRANQRKKVYKESGLML